MNIDEITTGPFTSPADLIDFEESLFDRSNPRRWAFRGQSQSYGTLVPSFQRIFREKRSAGAAAIIEYDLIKTFRQHYAALPEKTREMPDPNSIGEGYTLRCLSVMQHYGVPTRLLDWTSDFWTAVYFACAGDPTMGAELWVYDRNIFSSQLSSRPDLASLVQSFPPDQAPPTEPDFLWRRDDVTFGLDFLKGDFLVELDPKISPRMRKQFAHHTLSLDIFADHAPLLFDLAQKLDKSCMRRILIDYGCKERTLRFLEGQREITAGTIFPDVEGLSKFLHWHLESLITNFFVYRPR